MHNISSFFSFSFMSFAVFTATTLVHAETATLDSRRPSINTPAVKGEAVVLAQPTPPKLNTKTSFSAFTGKVIKNKVRLRLQPNLDSMILREFQPNDLVVVVGENEEFYAINPPEDIKAFIFRTFVLDGFIEGNRVNVRLEPDLSAPVIAQMNTGDPVKGEISAQDKKWMEISLPASVQFYVAKEYVEKIGDASVYATLTNERAAQKEGAIIVSQATEPKPTVAEVVQSTPPVFAKTDRSLPVCFPAEFTSQESPSNEHEAVTLVNEHSNALSPALVNSKMSSWIPVEHSIYENWAQQNSQTTIEAYYQQQLEEAVTLRGIIEPYNRSVRNKPGDFILVNQANHLPIAYLYSTQVNLQDKVGFETSVRVIPRDNHHFAFPAYFVLADE
jgi:hypothetical protein